MADDTEALNIQENITSDEELKSYTHRPGLLVLEIYSEWCGPCLGTQRSLREFKLENGGRDLSFATCKSDTIEAFCSFRRKSEPTWLFVTDGKAVNIMCGTDAPKIMSLIRYELKQLGNNNRPRYDFNELHRINEHTIAENCRDLQSQTSLEQRLMEL